MVGLAKVIPQTQTYLYQTSLSLIKPTSFKPFLPCFHGKKDKKLKILLREPRAVGFLEGLDVREYVQIVITTETRENAEKIADTLVRNRLVACVQIIGPMTSVYRWKAKIEKTTEWLCIVKTRRDLCEEVEASILQNHTYEVPEILAVPVVEGYESYLAWLDGEMRG